MEGEFARKLVDLRGNVAFVTAHLGMSLPVPGFVGFNLFAVTLKVSFGSF